MGANGAPGTPRDGMVLRARPAAVPSARDAYRYAANAGELRLRAITRRQRELAHERARHDDVAGPDAATELGELSRQPDHGGQRVSEHRVAGADGNLLAVQPGPRHHFIELRRRAGSHRGAEDISLKVPFSSLLTWVR